MTIKFPLPHRSVMASVSRFKDDTKGAITAFTVGSFMSMFLAVGMGVDFIRHEAFRAELQDALDRGVLAAAANGNRDPEQTIRDFLKSTNFVGQNYSIKVFDQSTLVQRKIKAQLDYATQTMALKLAGIDQLSIGANATAFQGVSDIEISLVLDISGSMAREEVQTSPTLTSMLNDLQFNNPDYYSKLHYADEDDSKLTRMDVMRVASADFVEEVLNATNKGTTSISLVPFSGQVNVGETVFNELHQTSVLDHNYSRCVDFTASDYDTTALPASNSRNQVPHFQWFTFEGSSNRGNQAEWGWCPSNTQEIAYLSNDPVDLQNRIFDFMGHDGTGTQVGMKWGMALLDPDSNWLVQELIDADEVSEDFIDRPYDFDDGGTLKVVVLMSDGRTRYQQRPSNKYYNETYEKQYFASNGLRSQWSTLGSTDERTANENASRQELADLCQLAEDEDVIVFTIGFDMTTGSDAQTDLETCASSQSHHFDVSGAQLAEAFSSIAVSISKLKLTQ